MRSSAAALAPALLAIALQACTGARPPPSSGSPDAGGTAPVVGLPGPSAALARFAAAVEGGRWDDAYALLSARWRARLTPARLAADFDAAGPIGRDAAVRVKALLSAGAAAEVKGGTAVLPVGEGLSARLLREGDAWRVDALE